MEKGEGGGRESVPSPYAEDVLQRLHVRPVSGRTGHRRERKKGGKRSVEVRTEREREWMESGKGEGKKNSNAVERWVSNVCFAPLPSEAFYTVKSCRTTLFARIPANYLENANDPLRARASESSREFRYF